jgi:hypothetical protein
MEIEVVGSGSKIRRYVEDMAQFSATKLMPKMKNISVCIQLVPFLLKKEGIYGDCAITEDCTDLIRPKDFVIRVDSRIKLRKMLITVAHEMVHVKQYARGELYDSTIKGMYRWQGKWISKHPDYWDQPWEIEALGRETGIWIHWVSQRKYTKQKWTKCTDPDY